MIIYHITTETDWLAAKMAGSYLPQTYSQDGFIHCSKKEQVVRSANKHFAGRTGLVLLKIDADRVPSRVVEENLDGGAELFPHIYGRLPVPAVIASAPLLNSENGFIFPEGI